MDFCSQDLHHLELADGFHSYLFDGTQPEHNLAVAGTVKGHSVPAVLLQDVQRLGLNDLYQRAVVP